MLEIARYDGRKRLKGTVAVTVGVAALTTLYVLLFPSITEAADLDELAQAYPPALVEAFGIRTLNTIEGFLATELYAFAWVLLLGLYFASAGAGLIAADVQRGRMDLTLSLPITRSRLLLEKFASLLVPLFVTNAAMPVVVFLGVLAIGEDVDAARILMAHALSMPYLLACGAIGLLASVLADRASVARRAAAGAVFALFLFESVVTGTDVEFLGALSPTRYYAPADILVDGTYDFGGAAILLAGTAALVLASREWFRRTDVE